MQILELIGFPFISKIIMQFILIGLELNMFIKKLKSLLEIKTFNQI